jgi:hypothetical protein
MVSKRVSRRGRAAAELERLAKRQIAQVKVKELKARIRAIKQAVRQ